MNSNRNQNDVPILRDILRPTRIDLLVLLFIGLKLSDNIDWSWWWVFSPYLIPLLVGFVVGIVKAIVKK